MSGHARPPGFLESGPALAITADGTGVFLTLTGRPDGPVADDVRAVLPPPSIVWSVIARRADLAHDIRSPEVDLVRLALERLRGWDPWLIEAVRAADRSRTAAFAFRAADPRTDLTPWAPGRFTAVGDAVHAMPPTGGLGAATAIRDADHLATALAAAGPDGLVDAVADYQARMPSWAVPAIRQSLRPVRAIRMLGNPALATVAAPLLAAAGAVGRRVHRQR